MPRFYFHFRDAKTIKDDLGEDFADIHAAGEHARRMARELADEPHGSGAAIIVSDGLQELFEIALAEGVSNFHSSAAQLTLWTCAGRLVGFHASPYCC